MAQYGDDIKKLAGGIKKNKDVQKLKEEMNEQLKKFDLPEKPKKPVTIYFAFRFDELKRLKAQNPDIKGIEINEKIKEGWESLSDKKKEKYQKEIDKETKEYDLKMEEYNKIHAEELE